MDEETVPTGFGLSDRLFRFLILGIVLVFVGLAIVVVGMLLGGSGSVGGVVFIGPIPIVFGAGPDSAWLILISLIVATLVIVVFVLFSRKRSS